MKFLAAVRALLRRRKYESEFDEEMQFHIAAHASALEQGGMSAVEATRRARVEFGGTETYKDAIRQARGIRVVDNLLAGLQDVAFAFRQFSRHRIYALTAIFSLALGIGATTAVFSVLYGVLLDPYPYRDSAHMVDIVTRSKDGGKQNAAFSLAEMGLLRKTRAITDVTSYHLTSRLLTGGEFPLSIHVVETSGNLFQFLGAPPLLGRNYTASEAPEGVAPPHLAVVSYRFWRSHLGSNKAIIGSNVEIDHQQWTVVGVMGSRFTWLDADFYVPYPKPSLTKDWFPTIVRVRPDLPKAAIVDELSILMHQLAARHPSDRQSFTVGIESLNDNLLGEFKGTLLTLFVAVFFLLLISCGNVSILLLSRGATRQFEISMRAALGASRGRLTRQLLTEAICLSALGGLLGIAISFASIRLLIALIPDYAIPHEVVISLNVPVLLFCLVVAMGTGLLSGLSPALRLSGLGVTGKVQHVTSRTVSSRRSRSHGMLIVVQIALTMLLLTASGAAMHRYLEAERAHLGFDPKNVLLLFLGFPEHGHDGWNGRVNYEDALLEKMKSVPGVRSAAVAVTGFPPTNNWLQEVDILGSETNGQHRSVVSLVSAEYFSVLRIPLLEGRAMTRNEVLAGAHVAVVSRLFAERFFSSKDSPLGKQVIAREVQSMITAAPTTKPGSPQQASSTPPGAGQPFQIVGIFDDVRNDGLHQPTQPALYLPSSAVTHAGGAYFVRTESDPLVSASPTSSAISSLDAAQAVDSTYTYERYLGLFVWSREQFISSLFSLFAAVALGLASIGLISTVAFQVEQRTHEIGIRYALGATRLAVLWEVLTPTAWLTFCGVLAGMLLSAAVSGFAFQWIQSSMRTPPLLAAVSGLLLLVATVAGLLTARRAMLVNPVESLRAE